MTQRQMHRIIRICLPALLFALLLSGCRQEKQTYLYFYPNADVGLLKKEDRDAEWLILTEAVHASWDQGEIRLEAAYYEESAKTLHLRVHIILREDLDMPVLENQYRREDSALHPSLLDVKGKALRVTERRVEADIEENAYRISMAYQLKTPEEGPFCLEVEQTQLNFSLTRVEGKREAAEFGNTVREEGGLELVALPGSLDGKAQLILFVAADGSAYDDAFLTESGYLREYCTLREKRTGAMILAMSFEKARQLEGTLYPNSLVFDIPPEELSDYELLYDLPVSMVLDAAPEEITIKWDKKRVLAPGKTVRLPNGYTVTIQQVAYEPPSAGERPSYVAVTYVCNSPEIWPRLRVLRSKLKQDTIGGGVRELSPGVFAYRHPVKESEKSITIGFRGLEYRHNIMGVLDMAQS